MKPVRGPRSKVSAGAVGIERKPRRLTKDEWRAIGEALGFRLADTIEDADPPVEVYESAWDKVQDRL